MVFFAKSKTGIISERKSFEFWTWKSYSMLLSLKIFSNNIKFHKSLSVFPIGNYGLGSMFMYVSKKHGNMLQIFPQTMTTSNVIFSRKAFISGRNLIKWIQYVRYEIMRIVHIEIFMRVPKTQCLYVTPLHKYKVKYDLHTFKFQTTDSL